MPPEKPIVINSASWTGDLPKAEQRSAIEPVGGIVGRHSAVGLVGVCYFGWQAISALYGGLFRGVVPAGLDGRVVHLAEGGVFITICALWVVALLLCFLAMFWLVKGLWRL